MVRRLAELEQRAAEIQAEAAALRQSDPTQVAQLRQLAQQESTLNSLYQTIAARYQEVSIQGSFPVTNGAGAREPGSTQAVQDAGGYDIA